MASSTRRRWRLVPVSAALANPLITSNEAARLIGVTRNTLRRYVEGGFVPCYQLPGGARRFAVDDIERFKRSLRVNGEGQ